MLLELRLENYAIIDKLAVEFGPGLNLLTGETGAGKSILIDALALLMGDKASPEVIRAGANRAIVSAVFELQARCKKAVTQILEQNGVDADEGNLIIRREIAAGGKGRIFINNQPGTLAVLKQLAPLLATIHAQNESILSFDAAARLELLDRFTGTDLVPLAESFSRWKDVRSKIDELERDEQDRLRLVDLWTYQQKEIDAAKPQAGEDERLEAEKRILANAERIFNSAMNAFDLLYEGDRSTSSTLRAAGKAIEDLARYEAKFQEAVAAIETARISVEEVSATLRDYAGRIHASPQHLAAVEERLAALDRLKRKYGPNLSDVIAFGAEVGRKIVEVENKQDILRHLRRELEQAAQTYLEVAAAVSRKRHQSACKLEKLVEAELSELAMQASFRIELSSHQQEGHWTSLGFDQLVYVIASNPGEPLRRLEQIASGGELSRVILALKAVVEAGVSQAGRKASHERTLIFDEIDNGIAGRAAEAVGKKLKALSRVNQVLCVTHLPQIATFADCHYLIQKKETGGRTTITIRLIRGEERTEEVARMLSGARLTETSRKHAEQMLKANA